MEDTNAEMTGDEQPESESKSQTVTVKVWSGSQRAPYEEILDEDPDEYEMDVVGEETYYVPHDDHVVLTEDIENHQKYAFHVETDRLVELHVETNDSHHSPVDGFDTSPSIERGLLYAPEGHPRYTETPFQTEIWGRIRMRVEDADQK